MAWERSFEARVLKIRNKELKFQKLNFTIEVSGSSTLISVLIADDTFVDLLECHLVRFGMNSTASQSSYL